jgi:hypothetical protein
LAIRRLIDDRAIGALMIRDWVIGRLCDWLHSFPARSVLLPARAHDKRADLHEAFLFPHAR